MLDRLFRVSGRDENDDVHAFETNGRQRAEKAQRQMDKEFKNVRLIGGYVVNVGCSAGQQWEYYGTAEEANARAHDWRQRGGRGVFVEDCNPPSAPPQT